MDLRHRHRRGDRTLDYRAQALTAHAPRTGRRGSAAPADPARDVIEQFDQVRPSNRLAGHYRLTIAQQIPAAQFAGVDPKPLRDHVHLAFVGPRCLVDAVAAESAGRRQVRVDGDGVDADVRDRIRPGRGIAAVFDQSRSNVGVRAGVELASALPRDEPAVRAHTRLQPDARGMLGNGYEFLRTL